MFLLESNPSLMILIPSKPSVETSDALFTYDGSTLSHFIQKCSFSFHLFGF